MNYSDNYNFNLPSRDGEDAADINVVSANFVKIDTLIKNNETNIESVTAQANSNAESIESITVRVLNHAEKIDSLETSVENIESDIEDLEDDIADLKSAEIVNLTEYMDYKKALSGLNFTIAPANVGIYENQYRVQVSPVSSSMGERVLELYSFDESQLNGRHHISFEYKINTLAVNAGTLVLRVTETTKTGQNTVREYSNSFGRTFIESFIKTYKALKIELVASTNCRASGLIDFWVKANLTQDEMMQRVNEVWYDTRVDLAKVRAVADNATTNLENLTENFELLADDVYGLNQEVTSTVVEDYDKTSRRIDNLSSNKKIKIDSAGTYRVCGANLIDMGSQYHSGASGNVIGVNWYVDELGRFHLTGTSTATAYGYIESEPFWLSTGGILSGSTFYDADNITRIAIYESYNGEISNLACSDNGSEHKKLFFVTEPKYYILRIEIRGGVTFNDTIFAPCVSLLGTQYASWLDNKIETVNYNEIEGFYPTTIIMTTDDGSELADIRYEQNLTESIPQVVKNKIIPSDELSAKINELIQTANKAIYVVGSIYLSTANENPANLFGFGTWMLVGEDRVLVGAGNAYDVGTTGGEEWHTHETAFRFASYYNEVVLENHEETGVVNYDVNGNRTATGNTRVAYTSADSENNYYNAGTESSRTASGQIGVYETKGNVSYAKNLPPYLAVYVWQRIA